MALKAFELVVGVATIVGAVVAISQCASQAPGQRAQSEQQAPTFQSAPATVLPPASPTASALPPPTPDAQQIVAVQLDVYGAAKIGPHEFGCCGILYKSKVLSAAGEMSWQGCYVRWTFTKDGELYTTDAGSCGSGGILPGPRDFTEPGPGSYLAKADVTTDWGATGHAEYAFTVEKTHAN